MAQVENDNSGDKCTDKTKSKDKEKKDLIAEKPKALSKEIRGKLPEIVLRLYNHQCKYNFDKNGSITFYPSPHLNKNEYGTKVLKKEKFAQSNQLKDFLSKLGCHSVEAMNDWETEIVSKKDSFHGFARAMEIAYFDHYPLKIKVSHVWLLILHGLTAHIDLYNDELRSQYVNDKGKMELTVDRMSFVKGSRKNNWDSVIDEFAQKIDQNTKNNIGKIVENDFSVSTELEQMASKISLMSACKHYFTYVVRGGCGFPAITLDGTKQDWINLKSKVSKLFDKNLGLMKKSFVKEWEPALIDILNKFIDCYDGKIDSLFWNSMVRRGRPTSGAFIPNDDPSSYDSYYSGWINVFFPYLNQLEPASYLSREKASADIDGTKTSFEENEASFEKYSIEHYDKSKFVKTQEYNKNPLKDVIGAEASSLKIFPIGLANAHVTYKDFSQVPVKNYQLKLAAGFIGVEQDPNTLQVSPKIGWFAAEH